MYASITKAASEDGSLATDELEKLADGHTRGVTVGIHDDVGSDSLV